MKNKMPSIREVFKDYKDIELPETGGKIKCLVHKEDTPSMHYYPESNTLYCYGACNKSYNPVSLLQELKGISPREALAEIQSRYGLRELTEEELNRSNRQNINGQIV